MQSRRISRRMKSNKSYETETSHPAIKLHSFPITGDFYGWWNEDGSKFGPTFEGQFRSLDEALKAYNTQKKGGA